ncbi:unnamed protein product [Penicillium salamii]|nr:unnamed protein product [Penicillium salamii]CAG8235435.1 unnamed protein product [Penicillium salamii]
MVERPQYFENTLTLPSINAATLSESLQELRTAVHNGAQLVKENSPLPEAWGPSGLFRAFPGIALAFLRLDYQSSVLKDARLAWPDYRQFALQRIPSSPPDAELLASRLSPLGSSCPITAIMMQILANAAQNNWQDNCHINVTKDNITCLRDAVQLALKNEPLVVHDGRRMGGDEVLFGRAGLLWALLSIRSHRFDQESQRALSPVLESIPELIRVIIDAGKQGSREYIEKNGVEGSHPLMYAWMEGYYCFGAVHGATGILTILLSCEPEELAEYIPVIGETISALCQLSATNDGHLPMTAPSFSFGQRSELVQLCHGIPGLLILLGAAFKHRGLTHNHWNPSWDQAIYLGSGRIWEEGLLSKGGSLCHGVSGNAWAWLLLHDAFEYNSDSINDAREAYLQRSQLSALPNMQISQSLKGDFFLSRALAFMLHARETKPYNASSMPSDKDYRMPDEPYTLFEGLAGNVCAWAETCTVLQARLRKMELVEQGVCARNGLPRDSIFQHALSRQIGFPALGGNGAMGIY